MLRRLGLLVLTADALAAGAGLRRGRRLGGQPAAYFVQPALFDSRGWGGRRLPSRVYRTCVPRDRRG